MKLVLIGIPGAGKSTQGNLLSKQLGLPYLSTGHIFREMGKEKTSVGRYIKETVGAGLLIPDEKTVPIVEDYLSRKEYKKGYILDGFPRNLNQVKQFKNGIDKLIYIELPDKEALWRIAYRHDDRDDQTVAVVMKRIEIFHKITKPVIAHYESQGKLISIDGTKTIEEVNEEILRLLGKQFFKNKVRAWRQKQKIILAVAGLPGSGKTETVKYFKNRKFPVVRFGQIIDNELKKRKLTSNEKNNFKIRTEIREKHGMAAMAILNKDVIEKELSKNDIVLIDGLRSYDEYRYLQKEMKKVNLVVIALWAGKKRRYERISKRSDRSALRGPERDINEVLGTNMGPTIALADYNVINDGSLDELHNKLEHVFREVYYGLD